MNIVIVPGYGDRVDYLHRTIRNWPDRFGNKAVVLPFGWSGEAAEYDKKNKKFLETIEKMGEVSIIGISAGASAALRAQHVFPERVGRIVTLCGPVRQDLMNKEMLRSKYPLLKRSLDDLALETVPGQDVLTLRPLYDGVVPVEAMIIPGAVDMRMKMIGHPTSIAWGMYHHAADMNRFLSR